MFVNKTNEDQDLEVGLINDISHNETPTTSNPHNNCIDIPLRTFKVEIQENGTEEENLSLVSTEFGDLQVESDEREKELVEAGKRQIMRMKRMEYKRKIGKVISAIETFKAGIGGDDSRVLGDVKYHPKWTDLHHASARGLVDRIQELIDDGDDPNVVDDRGRTVLDVAGIAHYQGIKVDNLSEALKILLAADGRFNTMKGNIDSLDTPIHTAVELNCLESIKILLDQDASVKCLNSAGLTPLHICIKNKFEEAFEVLLTYQCADAELAAERANTRDISGFTLLQATVVTEWMEGVNALLDAGGDVTATTDLPFDFYNNVIIEDASNFIYRLEQLHETPVHLAAEARNRQILRKLLAKRKSAANHFNHIGQSPLYIAIRGGHINCVETLLNIGADILRVSNEDQTALHVAIQFGFKEVAEFLLEYVDSDILTMFNSFDKLGYAPIHTAVANNCVDGIELLGKKNAFLRLKTKGNFIADWTPMHIAAAKNYPEAAELILKFDEKAMEDVDHTGRCPIHLAASRCNRELMIVMLRKGAFLSSRTKRYEKVRSKRKKDVTALEMISTELPNPKTFFREAFDSFIESHDSDLNKESGSLITMNYGIFTTVDGVSQIKVLEELLRCNQQELLLHPLVESLIYLKWRSLLPFIYVIVLIYGYIALALYAVIIGDFYDEKRESKYHSGGFLVPPLILVVSLEAFFISVHRGRYFCCFENWTKILCILFTMLLLCSGYESWTEADFPRHVATGALLLSWAQIMFLLSRFPYMGIYVLMFSKVSINILKILLTFAFLLIAFSLSFMIQFHSTQPFDGFWSALIKTIVMMTSEFEYEDLFDDKHSKLFIDSKTIVQILFMLFLIFVSIVFVNFMLGVAVSDVNDLKTDGDIRRLEKQVEYLSSLDVLVFVSCMRKILKKSFISKRYINAIAIKAGVKKHWVAQYEARGKDGELYSFQKEVSLPPHILDNIFEKIKTKKEQKEEERKTKLYRMQIDMLYKTVVGNNEIHSREKGNEANIATKFDGAMHLLEELTKTEIKHRNYDLRTKQNLIHKTTQTDPIFTEP